MNPNSLSQLKMSNVLNTYAIYPTLKTNIQLLNLPHPSIVLTNVLQVLQNQKNHFLIKASISSGKTFAALVALL